MSNLAPTTLPLEEAALTQPLLHPVESEWGAVIPFDEDRVMYPHISYQAIDKLCNRLHYLKYNCGVPVDQITIGTLMPRIREILGDHDVTGRLAAQIRQAFLQGAI